MRCARSWAVEWDASAIDFLLEKGFTPDLGARPLKRAIDRHLLAPLAETIVNRQVPEGDQFLFVTRDGERLQVEFVDPDAPSTEEAGEGTASVPEKTPRDEARDGPTIRSVILQAEGRADELRMLATRMRAIEKTVSSEKWQREKTANMSMMQLPDFWKSPERFDILGAAEMIDRIEAATRRAGSLLNRIGGGRKPKRAAYPADMVTALAQSIFLLETAIDDVLERRPRDAYLMIETSDQTSDDAASAACAARLAAMYTGWARKRRMQHKLLPAPKGDERTVLAVSGFGAHHFLSGETGLHVFEDGGKARGKPAKVSVRVTVTPQPATPAGDNPQAQRHHALNALAEDGARPRKIVRRYRENPSPLVRDAVRGWRTGRLDRVLAGDFDLIE